MAGLLLGPGPLRAGAAALARRLGGPGPRFPARASSSSAADPPAGTAPPPAAELKDSFLNGTNAAWLEAQEAGAPAAGQWGALLHALEAPGGGAALSRAFDALERAAPAPAPAFAAQDTSVKVLLAQQAFRDLGHVAAALDPLGLEVPRPPADLHPEYHGLGEAELCHPVVGGRKVSRPTPSFPIRR